MDLIAGSGVQPGQATAADIIKHTHSEALVTVVMDNRKYTFAELKQAHQEKDEIIVYSLQRELKELMIGVRRRILELQLRGFPVEKAIMHEVEQVSERGV